MLKNSAAILMLKSKLDMRSNGNFNDKFAHCARISRFLSRRIRPSVYYGWWGARVKGRLSCISSLSLKLRAAGEDLQQGVLGGITPVLPRVECQNFIGIAVSEMINCWTFKAIAVAIY
ncbi:hypothetical protein SUGI_0176290 [Cryptomeria japonica]|nr:hypothetical protein SUGI_0176290 [Cryptomeria japonica]